MWENLRPAHELRKILSNPNDEGKKRKVKGVFTCNVDCDLYTYIYVFWIYIFWLYDDDPIVFWLSSTLSFSFPFCQNMFYMMFSLQKKCIHSDCAPQFRPFT